MIYIIKEFCESALKFATLNFIFDKSLIKNIASVKIEWIKHARHLKL
jgi:hypothetical protein